jgi:hypothetical protein
MSSARVQVRKPFPKSERRRYICYVKCVAH